jgi:hypothetical protein
LARARHLEQHVDAVAVRAANDVFDEIRLAPAARATGIAISPIDPTPVITTDFTDTSAAMTVCTALPSGSNTAAQLSGIDGSSFHTFDSGMRM